MHFVLNLKIAGVLKVRSVSYQWRLHTFLHAKSPSLAAFDLDSEVFLEIHVPISVVTIAAYKSFNFASCVADACSRRSAWEVTRESVAHLIS